uniref:Uncharacterized protein n=1 Tax=Lactuca sativa TaxID=4236 RepID=A0A9R1ULC6_LACSA|nr:hypothetical protein LSAT_V11C800402540 [Lactuca sativa]
MDFMEITMEGDSLVALITRVGDEEFEDFMDEAMEEVVQQIPMQVKGGIAVRGWKIWCLVGLIAIVWVMDSLFLLQRNGMTYRNFDLLM